MLLRSILIAALFGAAGCENKLNGPLSFGGFTMTDFFAYDGERTWEFVSEDIELDYILIAELLPEEDVLEDVRAVIVATHAFEDLCRSWIAIGGGVKDEAAHTWEDEAECTRCGFQTYANRRSCALPRVKLLHDTCAEQVGDVVGQAFLH